MIDAREHAELTELLPWYLNGTLERRQRSRLERHLERCAACRADLALEQRLQRHLADASAVEHLPAQALKKLQQQIDALGAGQREAPLASEHGPRSGRVRAMSIAACVVAVLFIAALWALAPEGLVPWSGRTGDAYRTVTSSPSRPAEETVRAVFAPTITLLELQRILDEAGLRIIAGPTEAGVYSLAPTSSRPTTASLAALRRHPEVRFAERTRLEDEEPIHSAGRRP